MSFLNFSPELLLSLCKLTAMLLLALIAAPLIQKPAMRAAFWSAIFIILPLAIVTTHGRTLLDVLPTLQTADHVPTTAPHQLITPPQGDISPERPASSTPVQVTTAKRGANPLLWIFIAGLGLTALPILTSLLRSRFIRKHPASGQPVEIWNQIHPQQSGTTPIYFSDTPSAPCTIGLLHACILLPQDSSHWSQRRLKSTLLHEAAHIRRRDTLFRGFASLVRAALWFHPLVWLAHRQLISAQEEACDEIAVGSGIAPDEYAEDLLQAVKYNQSSGLHCLSMARWSQLGSRVHLILKKQSISTQPITMKHITLLTITMTTVIFGLSSLGYSEKAPADTSQTAEAEKSASEESEIETKLRTIIIPSINFDETTLTDTINFLRLRSSELDPEKKGVDFVLRLPKDRYEPVIPELKLRNVSLKTALDYICELTDMSYTVDQHAVTLRTRLVSDTRKPAPGGDTWQTARKARKIIIPNIIFEDTTLNEAIDYLRMKSVELDKATQDPKQKGVNFVVRLPRDRSEPVIKSMSIKNVPLEVALKYICNATEMTYQIGASGILVTPQTK